MSKYSEKDVVRLKREITILSEEVRVLIEQRNEELAKKEEEYAREMAHLDAQLAHKKSVLASFDKFIVEHINKLKKEEKTLLGIVGSLKNVVSVTTREILLLRKAANSIKIPEQDFTFSKRVAAFLTNQINSLETKHGELSKDVDSYTAIKEGLVKEIADLRTEKKELIPQLEHLRSEIKLGNDKNGRLGQEYLRLEEKMADIRRREHNVRAMMKRM